jgi:hypothetical protein
MAVASLLAEAVAIALPVRAPGVPAWPSSFRVNSCPSWFEKWIVDGVAEWETSEWLAVGEEERARHG